MGGPPMSTKVKLASTFGFARTAPVFSSVTAMTTASGIFRPGLSGSGRPDVQIVVYASMRLGFFGSCQRKNSCDCEWKSYTSLFEVGRHVFMSIW
jgi:hypothetical protein